MESQVSIHFFIHKTNYFKALMLALQQRKCLRESTCKYGQELIGRGKSILNKENRKSKTTATRKYMFSMGSYLWCNVQQLAFLSLSASPCKMGPITVAVVRRVIMIIRNRKHPAQSVYTEGVQLTLAIISIFKM